MTEYNVKCPKCNDIMEYLELLDIDTCNKCDIQASVRYSSEIDYGFKMEIGKYAIYHNRENSNDTATLIRIRKRNTSLGVDVYGNPGKEFELGNLKFYDLTEDYIDKLFILI